MWGFEVTPANLPSIYWSHSLDEIQQYLLLRLNWFQAQALQQYQMFNIILSNAFGGKDDGNSASSEDFIPKEAPKTIAEAKYQLDALFGGR